MSFFESITELPEDPIFHLASEFAADSREKKVNLGIGGYKDSNGYSLLLTAVKHAETNLLSAEKNKDYLPIEGHPQFIQKAEHLVFGSNSGKLSGKLEGAVFSAQTPGGTGALRIGGEFLAQNLGHTLFLSYPTWPNHPRVFHRCGIDVQTYRYYDAANRNFDFKGMCDDIRNMPERSMILLQALGHNPTGLDPNFEQWQEISSLIKKRHLFPFFDVSYQGFGESIEEDNRVIRDFAECGHEMLVACSFSKNFGLYNERVGLLSLICLSKEGLKRAKSQIKQIIRNNYSNPPCHGAFIVNEILSSDSLKKEWSEELANMRFRINEMRKTFVETLQVKASHIDWNFLRKQRGFFAFCNFSKDQVNRLKQEFAVYLPADGRINVAGLNNSNMDYAVSTIVNVM